MEWFTECTLTGHEADLAAILAFQKEHLTNLTTVASFIGGHAGFPAVLVVGLADKHLVWTTDEFPRAVLVVTAN